MEESEFIERIRGALARHSSDEEAAIRTRSDPPSAGPSTPLEARILRFCAEAAELPDVRVIRVKDWQEAREQVARMLREKRAVSAVVAGKDLSPMDGFWKPWGPVKEREAVEKADVGVVQADFGIADTGSVVVMASRELPRIASLLPRVCIFALSVDGMMDSMAHVMEALAALDREGKMPSTVNVVTGPSSTGDIELSHTIGVHGPQEVSVVLVG